MSDKNQTNDNKNVAYAFDVNMMSGNANFGDVLTNYIDTSNLSTGQLAQYARHVTDAKDEYIEKQYKILTMLALFTGNEQDFSNMQRNLNIPEEFIIDRATFYRQLNDYVFDEDRVIYHPFVSYVVSQTKNIKKSIKKIKSPTVIEYLSALQRERLTVDPVHMDNDDQRFTRKEALERNLIIPKYIKPIKGKGKNALFDTITAVPQSYFSGPYLKAQYKLGWDSPMLRSRKTKYALFSKEANNFPDFDKHLKELGDLYGFDVDVNEMQCFKRNDKYEPVLFGPHTDNYYLLDAERKLFTTRRYRRHYSNSLDILPSPQPESPGSSIKRVKVNDYELFAESMKALMIAPYHRSHDKKGYKDRRKYIARVINTHGRGGRKKSKYYYQYIMDVAAMMATRNALYAYDFESGKEYGENSKSVSLSLDQGIEFMYGNKLAAFYEPKARWLIPIVQHFATQMTYDFYKKKGVTPQQIAEGMRRVNLKPGTVRNVSASEATEDDYAMVLYNTLDRYGSFEINAKEDMHKKGIINSIDESHKEKSQEEIERDALTESNWQLYKDISESQKLGISLEEYRAQKAQQDKMIKDQAQKIIQNGKKREEIIESILEDKKPEDTVGGVTFGSVIQDIDAEDDIDRVIDGQISIDEISQDYINKSETEGRVYSETIASSLDDNPIIYIHPNGDASYSLTEVESVEQESKENVEDSKSVVVESDTSNREESVTNSSTKETISKPAGGIKTNIAKKIRTSMYKKFNSNLQKMKLDAENKLNKKLQSIEGKRITKATEAKIEQMRNQVDFLEDLILDNIETFPELAKLNKFSTTNTLSGMSLMAKCKSDDPKVSKMGKIQREIFNMVNEAIAGVMAMAESNPKEYSGKTVTQLVSIYKKQELTTERNFIKQVVNEVTTEEIQVNTQNTKSEERSR